MDLIDIARELAAEVDRLAFASPVTHVYNPLAYAWDAHAKYLERFGDAPKEVKIRHIGNCLKADQAYGEGVASALGIKTSEIPK